MFGILHRICGRAPQAKRVKRPGGGRGARTLRFETCERRELMTASPAEPSLAVAPLAQAAPHAAELSFAAGAAAFSIFRPAAPLFTATAASATEINLSWSRAVGASGYLVDEWIHGAWMQIGSFNGNATGASVTGLTPDSTYYFDVASYNAAGTAWANYEGATTLQAPRPAAPSFTAAAISSSQIDLSWNAVSGATGYQVDEWINGAWSQIGNYHSGTTAAAVSGLNPNTTYYFDVGASNAAGTSWANYQSTTTLPTSTLPAAPSFTATVASGTQVTLSWSQVSGATSYQVEELINGSWSQIGNYGSGTSSAAVTGLSPDTTYEFKVGASNAAGTSWAAGQSVTTSGNASNIDHPSADAPYLPVSGSLFAAGGPVFTDIHQGQVGDCWLMSSLAEVAARDPADITGMFTADGTMVENGATVSLYTVRFYDSAGVAKYVTVDAELPAAGTYYDNVEGGVLWVALAEKAYAEANGQGIVTTQQVGSDTYDALDGGDPSWALQAITGKSSSDFSINPSNIAAAWNAGELIVLGSSPNADDNLVVGDSEGTHAYAVVSYNAASSTPFELYNPWGLTGVGGTISFNGGQVYGGAFYATANLISQDFSDQFIGAGSVFGTNSGSDVSQDAGRSSKGAARIEAALSAAIASTATSGADLTSQAVGSSTSSALREHAALSAAVAANKPQSTMVVEAIFADWTDAHLLEIGAPVRA